MSALLNQISLPPAEAEFPCSSFQSGLLHHFERFGTGLNATFRFKLEGSVDTHIVRRALQSLVDRHEILRTTFHKSEAGFIQRVHGSATLPFSAIDLSEADPSSTERLCDAIGGKEVDTPFDLAQAPLARAALVRTGPSTALLLLTFHSTVIDGWSVGLLSREFIANAAELSAGRPIATADVQLHYADFTLWQKAGLDGPAALREQAYWERQLQGLARFTVPHDRQLRHGTVHRSEIIAVVVDRRISDAIEAFAARTGKTLFQIATAALALALRKLTEADEIVVSTPVALRDEEDAQNVVGPLLNTLVLRIPTHGTQTVQQTIDLVADVVADAVAHKALPLEEVVPPDANNFFPICPVNFTMLRALGEFAFGKDMSTGHFTASTLPSQSGGAVWDLNFFMVDRSDGWRLSLE
ncbi:condensation domain-containing protein, partial [Nostoc sp. NIES-2111]